MTTEALAEEEEETTHQREWLWRRRRKCSDNGLEESMTMASALADKEGPEGLSTTTGASAEKSLETM